MSLFRRMPHGLRLGLPRNRTLGLCLRGQMVVACLRGTLWVTAPDTGDVVLERHQSLTLHGRGRVVLQALNTARLEVQS